jgi:hypothetical protein
MPNYLHVCWKGLTLRIMFGSKCTLNWLSLEYINTYSIKNNMCWYVLYKSIYIHIFSIRGLFMSCKKTIHGCHIILGERCELFSNLLMPPIPQLWTFAESPNQLQGTPCFGRASMFNNHQCWTIGASSFISSARVHHWCTVIPWLVQQPDMVADFRQEDDSAAPKRINFFTTRQRQTPTP